MATQQEVIKKFMASLDTHTFNLSDISGDQALTTKFTTKILDKAINYATSGTGKHFSTVAEVIAAMKADINSTNNADTFLKNFCGIDFTNTDTGAITGSDAGGSTTKTAKSVVPETKTASSFTGNSFTVNGLTVKLGKAYKNLSPYEKYVWNNLHEHWIKGGLDLIAQSYGDNFSFGKNSSATVKEITVTFFEEIGGAMANTSAVWNTGNYFDDYNGKKATGLTLSINLAYYKTNSVNYADLDGKINGVGTFYLDSEWKDGYLDRNIAHELTHAVMYANINYFGLLPRFIAEGMAELTHGADDLRKSDLKVLAANSYKLEQALNGVASIDGVSNPAYSGGYMFLRYLAKKATETTQSVINNSKTNTIISGSDKNDIISNSGKFVTINAGAGNDSIENSGYNVTLNGGADNDTIKSSYTNYLSISGGAGNDLVSLLSAWYSTIDGGNGNDTIISPSNARNDSINGGAGNDIISLKGSYSGFVSTIAGGTGNDTIYSDSVPHLFKYSSGDGNDKIFGFNVNSTLQIGGGNGTYSSTKSGNNIIVTVGDGKISLMGTASLSSVHISGSSPKPVNINNTKSYTSLIGTAYNDTIKNTGSKVTIYGGAGNDSIVNTNRGGALSLAGSRSYIDAGNGNDYIENYDYSDYSYVNGGSGNDTIFSRAANSTIYGGEGNDSIKNITGNILINGNAGNDTISNSGSKSTIYGGNGNDKIYNYATSTVTINVGNGADTITNWGSAALMVGGSGNDVIWGDAGKDTLTGGTDNDKLHGEEGNDKLYGNAGNDSLWGGKGNDKLWGDAGKDKFIYSSGDGNDTIYGFENNDMLQITGAFSASYSRAKDEIYFKVGSTANAITLSDFSATTFKVNGANYKISGSKLVKK